MAMNSEDAGLGHTGETWLVGQDAAPALATLAGSYDGLQSGDCIFPVTPSGSGSKLKVTVNRFGDGAGAQTKDLRMRLVVNGALGSENKAKPGNWPAAAGDAVYEFTNVPGIEAVAIAVEFSSPDGAIQVAKVLGVSVEVD